MIWVGEPHLVISPDGRRVARFGVDGDLGIWDVDSGRRLLQVEARRDRKGPGSTRIAFRPDGMRLAMARADSGGSLRPASTVLEWDLSSQKERTLRPRSQDTVYFGLAYSPDGSRLMSGGSTLGGGRRWIDVLDAATGSVLRRIEPSEGVMKSSYLNSSTDGRRLVIFDAFNGSLELYDTTSGDLLQVFHGSALGTSSVQFRQDGAGLVSIGTDHRAQDVGPRAHPLRRVRSVRRRSWRRRDHRRWDPPCRRHSDVSGRTLDCRGSRDHGRAASWGGSSFRVSRPRLRTTKTVLGPGGRAVAFIQTPTGAITGDRITVADVATGQVRFELRGSDASSYPGPTFRPDGLALALCTSGPSKEVQIRDATDGRVLAHWGSGPEITAFAYGRDGRSLAVAASERRDGAVRSFIRLHDPTDGRVLRTLDGNTAAFRYLAFSPDGTRLAAGNQNAENEFHDARSR